MKLYLIAPTYDDLHSNAEILTAIGWTVFDLRDVMRHMGVKVDADVAGPLAQEMPAIADVRKLTALEMMECAAVVLDDEIVSEDAHNTVKFCRYAGLRCVLLSDLLSDMRVSEELLDAHNIATIEGPREVKQRRNVRERVRSAWRVFAGLPHRFDTMVGDAMKNPMTRERRPVEYQENKHLTTTN